MMNNRLSPKKQRRNLSYLRNNRIIQKAFIGLNKAHCWHITLKQIIGKTKLSKKTLYTHYPDIDKALVKIEQELLSEYKIEVDKNTRTLKKIMPDKNRRFFYVTMLFMSRNKGIFVPVCNDIANYTLLHRMMEMIYPRLDITWYPVNAPSPSIGNERVDMYISMCVEILSRWGNESKCDIGQCEEHLSRLLRLTSEASMRCK